ncbi:hypothetical protein ACYPU5_07795 [Klebsiella pneumoniae]|uniref:hypothetical protein n=1 Tax=Klebsiella sp. R4 TaxID=3409968 RepID=UPI003B5CFF82
MMANILRSIPMLLVIGFNLLLAILFSLIYVRKHPETDLFIIITFTGMLSISTYIISFYSVSTFATKEKKKIKGVFPRRRGKLKRIITDSMVLISVFFVSGSIVFSGSDLNYGLALLAISTGYFTFLLVNYYFLCMSRVKEKIVKIINKILFIVFSIILFFSKMIANGFVKEFFDVDIAKVPYISWSFSILFAIPFFLITSHVGCMILEGTTDLFRTRKIKVPPMIHYSIFCLSCVFFSISYISYLGSAGWLFNAVTKKVYSYDTRSSFRCNNKYWTIPELGKDARYLAETSDSYRVIYIRGNNINVEVVKCKKNEGYILFPIENANDILKKQVPKGG